MRDEEKGRREEEKRWKRGKEKKREEKLTESAADLCAGSGDVDVDDSAVGAFGPHPPADLLQVFREQRR